MPLSNRSAAALFEVELGRKQNYNMADFHRDFEQKLPVISRWTSTDKMNACLKYSALCKNIKINYKNARHAPKRSISWDILTSVVENWGQKGAG
ncbi:unnamed protein product [Onchocerca ochengi]|uniref:DUF4050 domain-containing protein n=1 Tax=Onchocerca ochengi TaxID=42157 RepID=A0A182ECD2_ONCOC|nr:unnamed protein product [Onchocerca ochengi]